MVGRCPSQGEPCPGGILILGGHLSQWETCPGACSSWWMLILRVCPPPPGCLSPGKTDPKGISPPGQMPVLGGGGACPRGMPAPLDPIPGGRTPHRMPVPAGYPCLSVPASHGAAPHLCHLFSHSSCSQAPRRAVGLRVGPVAGADPHGPGLSNLRALPGPPPPPEPRGAVSPGQEW